MTSLLALLFLLPQASLEQKVQARLDELYKSGEFPGATVGWVLPDGHTGECAVGFSDLEKKAPMKPETRMWAGSIGKTYVAAIAFQLIQEGKLALDDPISRYIGDKSYFDRIPNARLLTVRHLMNHTSGIQEQVLNPDFLKACKENPNRQFTPDELAAYALDTKPLFEPGKGWSYADTNYNFLGLILEKITGKPVFDEVASRIVKPLKLDRTWPSDSRSPKGIAIGYSMPNSPFGFKDRVQNEDGKYPFHPQMEYCGGGMVSNALDLARWAKMMFEGKAYSAKIQSDQLRGEKARTGPNEKYGLGVQIRPSDWGETWGHSGWFPGYLSDMAYFPHKKFAVAVQFNTDHGAKLKMRTYRFLLEMAKVVDAEIRLGPAYALKENTRCPFLQNAPLKRQVNVSGSAAFRRQASEYNSPLGK